MCVCDIFLLSLSLSLSPQVLSRSGSTDVQKQFSSILGVSEMEVQGSYGIAKGSERNCVKLRGLPWATTPEQVIEFFGELKSEIAERGVHMVVNAQVRGGGGREGGREGGGRGDDICHAHTHTHMPRLP